MTIRRIGILLVACFLTSGCDNESKAANQEPKTAEAKLVGDWLGQQYFSQEYIDELHKMSPEVDRALLESGLKEMSHKPMQTLRLFADGTCEMMATAIDPPVDRGETWSLSDDGKVVTIAMQHPVSSMKVGADGKVVLKPSEKTETTTMKLVLSDDGQTLSQSSPDEDQGMRYLKAGSEAAKKAFKGNPKR